MAEVTPTHALGGLFMAIIVYLTYGIISLHFPPECVVEHPCLSYYLKDNPKTGLILYTASVRSPGKDHPVQFVKKIATFDYNVEQDIPISVKLTDLAREKGNMYLLVCVTSIKFKGSKWADLMKQDFVSCIGIDMIHRMNPSEIRGENKGHENEATKPVNHLKTVLGFNVVTGLTEFSKINIPPLILEYFRVSESGRVLPALRHEFLLERLRTLERINASLKVAHIKLKYAPINYGQLKLLATAEFRFKAMSQYHSSEKEVDNMKGSMNYKSLYFSDVISILITLHFFLDILAVLNDLDFWESKDSMVGISHRTLAWQTFSQGVIFLHLLSGEDSMALTMQAFVCFIMELWKTLKVLRFDCENFKFLKIDLSDEEKKTRKLDAQAMRYVSYILIPLAVSMSLYYRVEKKSSILETFLDFVYALNFVFMLPQLYLNHKFKSVSHLPWMSIVYRGCNTFIDKIFVDALELPPGSRVTWFRDDFILITYLIQRWWYMASNKPEDVSNPTSQTQKTVRPKKYVAIKRRIPQKR